MTGIQKVRQVHFAKYITLFFLFLLNKLQPRTYLHIYIFTGIQLMNLFIST